MSARNLGLVLLALAVAWVLAAPVSLVTPDVPSFSGPGLAFAGDPDQPAESSNDQSCDSGTVDPNQPPPDEEDQDVVQRVVETVAAILSIIF